MYFQGKREKISYTGIRKLAKTKVLIPQSLLFDSDEKSAQSDGSDSDSDSGAERNHILGIEDEFLSVLMKLRLGLTNLAITFRVSEATVSNIFITWLNFLYTSVLSKCGPIGGLYWITCAENSKRNIPITS